MEALEDRTLLAVNLLNHYTGMNFATGGGSPPDPNGAAGPTSYIETVNDSLAIFSPKATGAGVTRDTLNDFWVTQGGLIQNGENNSRRESVAIFDEQVQRFIVGEQFGVGDGPDIQFFLAISKSANPATLTATDWMFYSIDAPSESGFTADDAVGNVGYNHDALVFTLNLFSQQSPNPLPSHVQVISVSMSDLVSGVASPHTFSNDFSSSQPETTLGTLNFRPTVMHDSQAGDPMWLIGEGPNSTIDITKMTVLTKTPNFTETFLTVNPFKDPAAFPATFPMQPDNTVIAGNVDGRIINAAERNHNIVAAHSIGISTNEIDARWYRIDVSSGTPVLGDQGNVGAGANTYSMFPSIDINSNGAIGMSYMQCGTGAGQFLSVDITGRIASDPAGTMQTPVLVQAGVQNYHDPGEDTDSQVLGRYSSINVDSDGSFWIANEFADNEQPFPQGFANCGTAIANFSMTPSATSPPLVTPAANQTGAEESVQSFSLGSFSDSSPGAWTASVAWGDSTSTALPAPSAPGSLGSSSHTYAEEGTYTVTVTVQNTGDNQTGSGIFQVTVSDPSVSAVASPGSFATVEGNAALGTGQTLASFTDPAGPEALSSYSASINWGDGTAPTAGGIILNGTTFTVTYLGNHAYAEEGTYNILVTINHETSIPATVGRAATVSDPAVTASGVPVSGVVHSPFSGLVATFTDPGSPEALADYTATINWGDNSPTTTGTITLNNGTFTVSGNHTYTATGSITITTTIQHDTAASTPVMSTATISMGTAPAVTSPSNQTAIENAGQKFNLGSFSDPNSGPWSVDINWGNGSGDLLFSQSTTGSVGSQTNLFPEEGTYTVTVTVTNTSTTLSGSAMFTVTVSDVNVAALGGLTVSASENTDSSVRQVATFTDPAGAEPLSSYSASINWGDGTGPTAGGIALNGTTFTVTGSHVYAEEGTYTLTVTINHESSTPQMVTDTATVSDPAVTASGVPVSGVVHSPFSGLVATFTDPGSPEALADYTATINWGDNSPTTAGMISLSNGTFTVSGSHTYTTTGSFTITTTIHHDTATNATAMSMATIGNGTPPAVTPPSNQTTMEGASALLNLGSFTDPDGGPWNGDVNWGDGSAHSNFTKTTPGSLGTMSHTYAEEGSYTVTVTVTDTFDNQSGSAMSVVSVADPAVLAKPVSIFFNPSVAFTGAVATFTDPGGAEPNAGDPFPNTISGHYTATINWGDSTPSTTGTITQNDGIFTVNGTHTYTGSSSFTIIIQINHEGVLSMVQSTALIASTGQPVPPQMTKPISFWSGLLGQELIRRFGITSGGQTLGQWLATSFPNLYGGGNGAPNLGSFTNAQVGIFYMGLFNIRNAPKLDAEVLATALDIFTTTSSLGGSVGQQYGFLVNNFGLGAYTWNIGFNGAAFGVPNFTVETVFQILGAANKFAIAGEPWGSNTFLRDEGLSVFMAINGG